MENSLTGEVEVKEILTEHFEVPKTNEVYPQYNEFTVPDGYRFITVRSWYPCFYLDAGVPGFEGIINMSIPAGDRDLQIYCWDEDNNQWMMAGITDAWNAQGGMDIDKTSCFVYKDGRWSVALTDVPTKSMGYVPQILDDIRPTGLEVQKHRGLGPLHFGRYGTLLEVLLNMRKTMYNIDVEMFPGTVLDIPDIPTYGCKNAQFSLTWDDPNVDLGFSIIGPSGEEVLSTRSPGVSSSCHTPTEGHDDTIIPLPEGTETDMTLERLGECLPGETYQVCIFSMGEMSSTTDFHFEYSWEQNMTRQDGDCLASAAEGAVLASVINAPLLYLNPSNCPQQTMDALYKLGVDDVEIVDLGGYLSNAVVDDLDMMCSITNHFSEYGDIYRYIRDITNRNDVIFTTIDPFSYWYIADLEADGEYPAALSLGPATYLAAQHGSPVLILDNHPELSAAIPWHVEFWNRHADGLTKPTVSEMYITGTRVYDFLADHEFDQEGYETIITLAGQFDLGLTWDRVFIGKGKPGRFIGSPTDLSVWTSKTVFYPQIVFENPALKNPGGVSLINGSSSVRRFPWRGSAGLKILKESGEETFKYPVLDTLICYDHKFNSRASKYWGFTYHTADGDIPGETPSLDPIDNGVMLAVNGEPGGFLPDLSGSEVQPFYLRQGGFDPVFSTQFEANMHNLNEGVLLWMINTHGGPYDGGLLMFWDVSGENPVGYPPIPLAGSNKEPNPWRGYEWRLGSTAEPDTMTCEIHGILPALTGNPDPTGTRFFTSALDWGLAYRPLRDILGKVASLPVIKWFTPEWFQDTQDYYDGVIITVFLGRFGTSWYNGTQIEDEIDNIHSTGVSSVACLPAGKYLHLMLMRHGSVFQIMDPWPTSWYSDVWQNMVPRGIAMGDTIGEIYAEGIGKVGIQYIGDDGPHWWWDLAENVCLYGDPDLRIWTPGTEFSDENHWEGDEISSLSFSEDDGFYVSGHMPFGVDDYPNQKHPTSLITQIGWIVLIVALLGLLIIGGIVLLKKRH